MNDYLDIIAWNARVDNNTRRGLGALMTTGPHVIGLTEVARRTNAELTVPGYRLYRHEPRRALVNGRVPEWRNSAVLIRRDMEVKRVTWKRERLAWKGPKMGKRHDPRVWPEIVVRERGTRRWVKVAPALHFPFGDAQADMFGSLARWVRRTVPGRATVACGDVNMRFAVWRNRWQDARLRKRKPFDPVIHGYGVDHAYARNVKGVQVTRFPLYGSDHFAMRYRVWL